MRQFYWFMFVIFTLISIYSFLVLYAPEATPLFEGTPYIEVIEDY